MKGENMKDLHKQQHDQTVIKRQGGHTPGPWRFARHDSGNDVQWRGLAGYSVQSPEEGIAYNICRPNNAQLIAAAPDLLEALQDLYTMVSLGEYRDLADEIGDPYNQHMVRAWDAIAKADGKMPSLRTPPGSTDKS